MACRLPPGRVTNLTQHPATDAHPTWSPDGRYIAFSTNRDGNDEIYIMDRSRQQLRNLTRNPAPDTRPHWSPVPPRASGNPVFRLACHPL